MNGTDREKIEADFVAQVTEALKGDHNDLRKEAIILRAHRAALEALSQGWRSEDGRGWTVRHAYRPDEKYPQFCGVCGYHAHETLKHVPTPPIEEKPPQEYRCSICKEQYFPPDTRCGCPRGF